MGRHDVAPNRSLFIKRIPSDTRSKDLLSIFSKFGPVKDVYIPCDYFTKRVRGFAYVDTFESLSDAKYVIRKNVKIRLFGKELSVEFAQGERKTPKEMKIRYSYERRHYRKQSRYRSKSRSRTPKRRSYSRSRSLTPDANPYSSSNYKYCEIFDENNFDYPTMSSVKCLQEDKYK